MNEEERKQNIEKAKAKYREAWWESNNPETLFLGQVQEDILIIDFKKFHKATEQSLGRQIWAHEFADPEKLLAEFYKETPKATVTDVLNKLEKHRKQIIIVRR